MVARCIATDGGGRSSDSLPGSRTFSACYCTALDAAAARPDYAAFDAAFEVAKTTFLAPMMEAARFANVEWKLTPKAEGPMAT